MHSWTRSPSRTGAQRNGIRSSAGRPPGPLARDTRPAQRNFAPQFLGALGVPETRIPHPRPLFTARDLHPAPSPAPPPRTWKLLVRTCSAHAPALPRRLARLGAESQGRRRPFASLARSLAGIPRPVAPD